MNSIFPQLLEAIQPVVLSLVEIVLGLLVPVFAWKVNSWIKARVKVEMFRAVMDRVTAYAETAVLDVGQTYVKGVRKSGKWDGNASRTAKERARKLIKDLVGEQSLKELQRCLKQNSGGIDRLLDGVLEQTVARMKNQGLLPSSQTVQLTSLSNKD